MLNKTLLGSAAVIMAVAGAQAADLPSKKAAPATYVKICDAYGAGFYTIPGTDTCVKVGGYVRAEYGYSPSAKAMSTSSFGATSVAGAGGYAARANVANESVVLRQGVTVTTTPAGTNSGQALAAGPLASVAAAGANPATVGSSAANFVLLTAAQAVSPATALALADTLNIAQKTGYVGTVAGANGITGVAINANSGVITIQDGYSAGAYSNVSLLPSDTQDQSGFVGRARIDIDARTQTSIGTARTFIGMRLQGVSGLYNSNYQSGLTGGGALATSPTVENAIIQVAGITAGRTTNELFSFLPAYNYTSFSNSGFPGALNLLSYTAVIGGGVSATIGLEDRSGMSGFSTSPGFTAVGPGGTRAAVPLNIGALGVTQTAQLGGVAATTFAQSTTGGTNPLAYATGTNLAGTSYGGAASSTGGMIANGPYTLPNIVLALRMDQGWGAVQVMGSMVQNGAQTTFAKTDPSSNLTTLQASQANATTPTAITNGSSNFSMTATGWALGAGLKLNLPQIGAGDSLYLTGAYGVGDLDHVLGNNTSGSPSNMGREFGGFLRQDRNLYVAPSANAGRSAACSSLGTVDKSCFQTDQTKAWSFAGWYTHNWSSTLRSVFLGSYANITPPDQVRNTDWTLGGLSEARLTKLATQLVYSPTKDLDMGIEVAYLSLRQSLAATSVANGGTGVATAVPATWNVGASSNVWQSRMRIQRTF